MQRGAYGRKADQKVYDLNDDPFAEGSITEPTREDLATVDCGRIGWDENQGEHEFNHFIRRLLKRLISGVLLIGTLAGAANDSGATSSSHGGDGPDPPGSTQGP
jgi:hypothetical protein